MQHMHKQEQPHLHQHGHKRQQPCEQEHKQTKLSTHWRSRMTAAVAPQIPSCQQYSVSHLAAGSSKKCVAHSASLRRWCSPTRLLTAVSPTGDKPPFFIRERERTMVQDELFWPPGPHLQTEGAQWCVDGSPPQVVEAQHNPRIHYRPCE